MDSRETVDAREPQAEEFVGPSIRLEYVKSQNLLEEISLDNMSCESC